MRTKYTERVLCKVLALFIAVFLSAPAAGQSGLCDPNTPFFQVNLTGNPNGTWVSNPPVQRNGNCCGTNPPDKCIEFEVTLDPTAVAIDFAIASGAIPPGAMFYQVNCGPPVPVGEMMCVTGPGPHTITFCKPGNNQNTYAITSIAGPQVSPPDTIGNGCSTMAYITGVFEDSSIVWSEITSGTNAYLSYLDCSVNCDTVYITPQPGYPAYVDYVVCGIPTAPCYPAPTFCDTIRVHFVPPIQNTINPDPAAYCLNTPGVLLTGNINGGLPPYIINWTNGPNGTGSIVGTSVSYMATSPGTYSMIVYDATYPGCPSQTTEVIVTTDPVPIVNAGPDTSVCAVNAAVQLSGSVVNATGGAWSGGSGVFSPSSTALNAVYTPSAAEIANGSVTLTLTSTGNGSCVPVTDQVVITIHPQIYITVTPPTVCYGQTATLTATAAGGAAPYTYQWSTGATTQSISNASPGTYYVTVADANTYGCTATQTIILTENPPISLSVPFSNMVSCDIMVPITISASGGSGIAGYTWNTGDTSTTITVPTGMYIITAIDSVGCTATDTVSITAANSALAAAVSQPANLCFGATTTVQGSATGGFGNYSYSWSTNATTSSVTVGAGSYCLTVTDGEGCMNQACVTVTQSPQLTVSIPAPPVICNGAAATVTAFPSGGQAPYTYQWSTGESTASITAPAGTYTVTVTDSNTPSCAATATVTITEATPLAASGSSTSVSCFGGSNGSATVNASGSIAPYSYSWPYNGSTSSSIYGLPAGTYAVTVTDSIGCTQTIAVTVSQPPALAASVTSSTNASCYSGSNGSATVSASGGTPAYSYSWQPFGGNASTGTGLTAGTYTVTVADSKGCLATDTVVITQPAQLTAAVGSAANVSCNGGNDGSASVSAAGGTGGYSYYWVETGTTAAIATGLYAGTYNITVTDGAGCTAYTNVSITQPSPLTTSVTNVSGTSCYGGANGSAMVSASGGTPVYSFSWPSINASGPAVSNLSAGTYSYVVTDSNGCSITNSVTITEPAAVAFSSASSTDASCFGSCNGTASVAMTGGTGSYAYLWAQGQTSASLAGLCAGSYSVTVTDGNGCTIDTTLIVSEPSPLVLVTTPVAAHCSHPDGSASVSASGSVGGYSYSWSTSPVQTTSTATGLLPGSYIITVTDSNNCVATDTVNISNTPGVSVNTQSAANTSCSYTCDGTAAITGTGGTGPYAYSWNTSPAQNDSTATGLCPGSYMVVISDYHNCSDTAYFTITAPQPVTVTPAAANAAICVGDSITLQASAAGGTGNYIFEWNSGAHTGASYTVSPIINTAYTVEAIDSNGCVSAAQTVSVITDPVPIVSAGPDTTVCASAAVIPLSGSITNAAGGIWSGGAGTFSPSDTALNATYTPSAAEIAGGSVTLTLTSTGNGACAAVTDQMTITIAPQFSATVSDVLVCYGQTGTLSANVSGGASPYSYSWNTGDTTSSVTNLLPGTYTVLIYDSIPNGCTVTETAIISENPQLVINVPSSNVLSCDTVTPVTISSSGGSGNLSYLWSTGDTTSSISVPTGAYTITVTDTSGCSAQASINVTTVDTLLTASTTQPANLCFGATTTVQASASGGFGNYTYSWSTNASGNTMTAGAGTYWVIAADSAGCTDTAFVTLTESPLLVLSIPAAPVICADSSTMITGIPAGGQAPYTYSWSTGDTTASTTQPAGTYTLTVTDANTPGCVATATATITEASPLTVSGASTYVSCFGGSNGTVSVTPSGSIAPYSFSWSSMQDTTALITGVIAGTYQVTVTDSIGCMQSASITVNEPALLTGTISSSTNVSCFGGNNGSATITPSGGTSPYSYSWQPTGGTASAESGLQAGTYTVTITDSLGCTYTDSVTITEPAQLVASAGSVSHVSCTGGSNGSASVICSGGSGSYSYYWLPTGDTLSAVTGLPTGLYNIAVTDSLGCMSLTSVIINEPSPLATAADTITGASCNGAANGSVTVLASGGTPNYTCYWPSLNHTGFTASGLAAGSYNYTITDSNGCTITSSVTITEPTALTFNTAVGFDATCYGGCNGLSVIVPGGGQTPYTFLWSTGQTTPSLTNLCTGTYSVTVTDYNGCTKDTALVIGQPSPITIATTSAPADCYQPNGSASASASGGTGAFTYSWNTSPVQLTSTATGIVPGNYVVTVTDNNGCTESDTVAVANQPGVAASVQSITSTTCSSFCNGSITAAGTGGAGPYTYSWSTNPPQSSITVNSLCPGNYTVIISDANNCTDTAFATISAPQPVTLNTMPTSLTVCNGDSIVLTPSASGGSGSYTFQWNNGAYTGPVYTATPNVTTTYTVVAIDNNGCISSPVTITATVSPAVTAIVAPGLSICQGATAYLTVSAAGGTGAYNYTWYPGNLAGQAISVSPLVNTTYTVLVTDGCSSDTASIPLTVNPNPAINFSADLTEGCAPLCIEFDNNSTVSNNDSIVNWLWDFGDNTTSNTADPSHCFGESGAFDVSLTAVSSMGCSVTYSFTDLVTVHPTPTADFSYSPPITTSSDATIHFSELAQDETSCVWYFGDGSDSNDPNPVHTYGSEGEYCITLIAKNDLGCVDTAVNCLRVQPEFSFYVPNSFTPNGNGLNDGFSGVGMNIQAYEMMIFDRWGNLIFQADELDEKWDGRANGGNEIAQEDVYVYKIKVTDIFGLDHHYVGHVTLIK